MLDHISTPEAEEQDGPSLYDGLSLEVEQIILGYNVLTAKMRDLKGCFDHKQTVSMKVVADDIATVSGQVSILAGHLSSVIARYVNRRSSDGVL